MLSLAPILKCFSLLVCKLRQFKTQHTLLIYLIYSYCINCISYTGYLSLPTFNISTFTLISKPTGLFLPVFLTFSCLESYPEPSGPLATDCLKYPTYFCYVLCEVTLCVRKA